VKLEFFLDILPDSTLEPSPEPQTLQEEEIRPPEFSFEFEDALFKNLGNTSIYLCQKPLVPEIPLDPIKECFLNKTLRGLMTILCNEWLKEVEFLF
jgi:hypothetical protein